MDKPRKPDRCLGQRHLVTLLTAIGMCATYLHRTEMGVTMVAMTINNGTEAADIAYNSSSIVKDNNTLECPEHDRPAGNQSTPVSRRGEFNWNKERQGLVLSSFYYGYVVLQIPGGWIASRFSAKWTFGVAIFLSGVLNILVPICARTDYWLLVAVRALQGLVQGFTFPSLLSLNGKWHPPHESAALGSINQVGLSLGLILGIAVSGVLSDHDLDNGWPMPFYVYGAIPIVWFVFWCAFGFNSPDLDPRISDEEKDYIMKSINIDRTSHKIPWCQMLKSKPVWAHIILMFCGDLIGFTTVNCLPQYWNDVMKFQISENGAASALPMFALIIVSLISARIIDFIGQKEVISITLIRKLTVAVAFLPTSVVFVMIRFAGCDRVLGIALLTLALGILGFVPACILTNPLDLTRKHTGIVFGFSNTAGAIAGLIGPVLVGVVTNERSDREQWMIVFYAGAAICVIATVVYAALGSGERQAWDGQAEQATGGVHDARNDDKEDGKTGTDNEGLNVDEIHISRTEKDTQNIAA